MLGQIFYMPAKFGFPKPAGINRNLCFKAEKLTLDCTGAYPIGRVLGWTFTQHPQLEFGVTATEYDSGAMRGDGIRVR